MVSHFSGPGVVCNLNRAKLRGALQKASWYNSQSFFSKKTRWGGKLSYLACLVCSLWRWSEGQFIAQRLNQTQGAAALVVGAWPRRWPQTLPWLPHHPRQPAETWEQSNAPTPDSHADTHSRCHSLPASHTHTHTLCSTDTFGALHESTTDASRTAVHLATSGDDKCMKRSVVGGSPTTSHSNGEVVYHPYCCVSPL